MQRIYSAISGVSDIRKINQMIRNEVKRAKSRKELTELHKRSSYLVTLTHSPAWKEGFRGKIAQMRTAAKEEFAKTARAINSRCRQLGIEPNYDTKWGSGRR
ncbi:hypothetical protein DRO54_10035 [Candidatus Bathyarchaeota archaeon]|nr:MAG: hypothetical protein DRO54_10035 [Candidatus Bathyarchaeota archaeon]